jgi:hypothetical protein
MARWSSSSLSRLERLSAMVDGEGARDAPRVASRTAPLAFDSRFGRDVLVRVQDETNYSLLTFGHRSSTPLGHPAT